MKSKILKLSLLTAVSISSMFAEDVNLDSVVVSSDFRDKSLSKTTSNISVIKDDEIYDKADESFENIISKLPNVNFSSGASRAHYIQIRGIGERSQFVTPINPSVGIMVDGIDFSQSALGVTMFDVSQVEVLRGPQGTTFGANGLAGVINIKSNEPTKESQFHVEAGYGNYNKSTLGVVGSGEIVKDKLQGRLSFYNNASDGYIKNSFLKRENTNKIDELTVKWQTKWLASDNHVVDFNYIFFNSNNGYDAFTLDNSRDSHSDMPGSDIQKTNSFSLKSTYQLNPKMHLETKLSGSKSDLEYSFDEDWSYVGEFAPELYPYSYFDKYDRDRKQVDFDIRLLSDEDANIFSNSTAWTIGAYGKQFSEDLKRERIKEAKFSYFDSEYETNSAALYGQLDTKLKEKFTVITGLRVEKWDATYSDSENIEIDTDEVLLGGKIGLTFEQDSKNLHYITLSKGYKPGGVNADNELNSNAKYYDTESLWNIDMGRTASFFDDSLLARLNLFYGLREDQQVKSSVVKKDEKNNPNFIDYIANAAKTHYYGLELESDYYVDNNLHLFTNIGLLKSEFDEYTDPNPDALNVEGRAPAQSPEYQYNVGVDYTLADSFIFKADVEGRGSYYFSNRHNAKSKSYNLVNSSLTYNRKNWSATLWGRNLTDKDYHVRGFGSFGNNPANGYKTETYTQLGNPRTFGLTLSYDY